MKIVGGDADNAQCSFQKENVDNSCHKTIKCIYYVFEVLYNYTLYL